MKQKTIEKYLSKFIKKHGSKTVYIYNNCPKYLAILGAIDELFYFGKHSVQIWYDEDYKSAEVEIMPNTVPDLKEHLKKITFQKLKGA